MITSPFTNRKFIFAKKLNAPDFVIQNLEFKYLKNINYSYKLPNTQLNEDKLANIYFSKKKLIDYLEFNILVDVFDYSKKWQQCSSNNLNHANNLNLFKYPINNLRLSTYEKNPLIFYFVLNKFSKFYSDSVFKKQIKLNLSEKFKTDMKQFDLSIEEFNNRFFLLNKNITSTLVNQNIFPSEELIVSIREEFNNYIEKNYKKLYAGFEKNLLDFLKIELTNKLTYFPAKCLNFDKKTTIVINEKIFEVNNHFDGEKFFDPDDDNDYHRILKNLSSYQFKNIKVKEDRNNDKGYYSGNMLEFEKIIYKKLKTEFVQPMFKKLVPLSYYYYETPESFIHSHYIHLFAFLLTDQNEYKLKFINEYFTNDFMFMLFTHFDVNITRFVTKFNPESLYEDLNLLYTWEYRYLVREFLHSEKANEILLSFMKTYEISLQENGQEFLNEFEFSIENIRYYLLPVTPNFNTDTILEELKKIKVNLLSNNLLLYENFVFPFFKDIETIKNEIFDLYVTCAFLDELETYLLQFRS